MVRLKNVSGAPFEVGWINPKDQSIVVLDTVGPLGIYHLESFQSHQFEILELPSQESGRCELGASRNSRAPDQSLDLVDGECLTGYFEVTETVEQSKAPLPDTKKSSFMDFAAAFEHHPRI